MEVDGYAGRDLDESVSKSKENSSAAVNHSGEGHMVNGISNGFSDKLKKRDKEEGKDKHREKYKDHKDKHRDRDKYKDKEHRHSSSSEHKSKDRDKHSSSSSKDKDRERHKDKDGHRDKDKEGHREKESKHREEKREKEHKSSSSSHKDKEKDHREKDRSASSPSKHSSTSKSSHSSSKDKEKVKDIHSSSKEKDRSDKDKHRSDKDKSKHSSSDKSRHSSGSSSNRDREKDKRDKEEKSKHESSTEQEKVRKQIFQEENDSLYEGKLIIEEDPIEIKQEIKEEHEPEIEDSFVSHVETTQEESYFKTEDGSDDDIPLSARSKRTDDEEEDDDIPLGARKKILKEKGKKKRKMESEDEGEDDFKPAKKKTAKKPKVKTEPSSQEESSPRKKKKHEEEQEVWKWWEEEKRPDGVKWNYLEHKGPVFAPAYEPVPDNVKFFYDGKEMKLSEETEEVATFYARMLDHDYTTKEAFNTNFFKDWRKVMNSKEKEKITDLKKCNFKQMHAYFQQKSEERKAMTKEEKKQIKEKNEEIINEYGFCVIDGHKEKIGNFKIEPPGLFRGRGEHPKMGMLKKRVNPEDVLINCSKDSKIPEPPPGHKWKEVRHDNTVTWLASWTENVQGQVKYVMLNPSSKLKGEKDWQKYETARKLASSIDKIRREYREDWKSKEMRIRQRAVALYFIDILALRAGNEKDEDQADTVGCCSLRVEHITLHNEKDNKEFVVAFDFLGKDSIRYYNEVPVEKRVFKNLQLFMENKKGSDDLFDRLNTTILNKHLNELMEGLTAKVFRTYNASWTLQQQLKELTDPDYSLPEKLLAYNRANRAVAILCNHQRSIPKSHQKSMDNLKGKITAKREAIDECEKQFKYAKKDARNGSAKERIVADKLKKRLEKLKEQLTKLEVQETDREENKTIALGTSKLNYLDPRITVAWCKKLNVPIEKVYNKTHRQKFRWAIDMAGPEFVF